jgi:hypothetical protein
VNLLSIEASGDSNHRPLETEKEKSPQCPSFNGRLLAKHAGYRVVTTAKANARCVYLIYILPPNAAARQAE